MPQFDSIGPITTQNLIERMNDFSNLQEVDYDYVKMRLFAQSSKKWFRGLPASSIADLQQFHWSFLTRWEVKNIPLQILAEYESLRRAPGETIQDYCTRFNNVYSSIPTTIQPPPRLALIWFPDGFDVDMSYQTRDINPSTLEETKINDVSVEANLLAKRAKLKAERRVTIKRGTFFFFIRCQVRHLS